MTEQRRQTIRDSAHCLRSRLTYILLCSHTLRAQLGGKLSSADVAEFQQLDNVLEETKTTLQKFLRQLEPELRRRPVHDLDLQIVSIASAAEDAS
jgi:hypothetical protein